MEENFISLGTNFTFAVSFENHAMILKVHCCKVLHDMSIVKLSWEKELGSTTQWPREGPQINFRLQHGIVHLDASVMWVRNGQSSFRINLCSPNKFESQAQASPHSSQSAGTRESDKMSGGWNTSKFALESDTMSTC